MSNGNINLNNLSNIDLANIKADQERVLQKLKQANEARQKQLQAPDGAAKYLKYITGGDALSINNVIWPYFFVVTPDELIIDANGGRGTGSFENSQEACFIWTKLTKVVYEADMSGDPVSLDYINPRDFGGNADANGLSISMSDGSSSRTFMDQPIPLDQIGDPTQPFIKDRPMLMKPVQRIQVDFANENPNRAFIPFLIFHGYRMRVEAQHDLQSLQTATYR